MVGVAVAGLTAPLALASYTALTADAQSEQPATEPPSFVAVSTSRIRDTRNGTGTVAQGELGANRTLDLHVAGRTLDIAATVPADALRVVLNATLTDATGLGAGGLERFEVAVHVSAGGDGHRLPPRTLAPTPASVERHHRGRTPLQAAVRADQGSGSSNS